MTEIATIDVNRLAKVFGVTDKWITDLEKKGIVIKISRGVYDYDATVMNHTKYLREQAANNQGEMQSHKIRKMKAEADTAEANAKEKTGELINKAWALIAWGEAVQMMKANLLGLPSKLVQLTRAAETDAEARQILENGIKKALSSIANVEIISPDSNDSVS